MADSEGAFCTPSGRPVPRDGAATESELQRGLSSDEKGQEAKLQGKNLYAAFARHSVSLSLPNKMYLKQRLCHSKYVFKGARGLQLQSQECFPGNQQVCEEASPVLVNRTCF